MPDRDLLTTAARDAGAIALRFWKRDPRVWEKSGDLGPVTEADLAVNAALETALRGARPDYGWLSEESADDPARLAAERVFIVDPIDGTRSFIAGEDTFAVSLAVAERGTVVAAAVYLPALDRMYAADASGATRDGVPLQVSRRVGIPGASLLTTRANLLPEHWPGGVPELKRSFRSSIAFRMCLVAEGRHDGMLSLRDSFEWDIAAGDLIARRAGATVTDRHGAPLVFNRPQPWAAGVLAAAPGLHGALMDRLVP
ncbi:3'(2'),5'-bisphosphate nucleotidase CysQ [Falsirhodobacter sp. 20TX0035]|uniref:3'(2'),5'-bisphosphate nucleotidase CysQ n=1 Tax=Falsirhodobacter sp. 20TX0035 TaxID=3022019 RepID=UPI00232F47B9|nr:3'(2'),5'-bisphosphate nucleotidase CysQ [Falsirhodobacter sp. 20TX0035]MDB6452559.1 3'(2'),5'-bisphosphate nucleotidase CysQ [Falsirhodobacter sp. 20TX0035]